MSLKSLAAASDLKALSDPDLVGSGSIENGSSTSRCPASAPRSARRARRSRRWIHGFLLVVSVLLRPVPKLLPAVVRARATPSVDLHSSFSLCWIRTSLGHSVALRFHSASYLCDRLFASSFGTRHGSVTSLHFF